MPKRRRTCCARASRLPPHWAGFALRTRKTSPKPSSCSLVRKGAMTEEMDLCSRSATLPYALLRVARGLNICLHGIVRWAAGLRTFAESLLPMFERTPLPTWSVYSFGYLLPVVEETVGACVLFGFQTRRALISGSVLML